MRKILFFFFPLIVISAIIAHNNSNPKIVISGLMKKGQIRPGDLKYRINLFGVIPIGEATFSLEEIADYQGQKVYHLNAAAYPLKYYSNFFKGYAILDSYVDMRSLSPVLFRQKVEAPGKENPYKEVFYDQKKGNMTLGSVVRNIYPNTQDPLSAVFNLRRMDFDKTKTIEMNINTNQKNYILTGDSKQKVLSISDKTYKITFVNSQIKRRDKDSYHKSKVTIVLLKDKENIPVLIKVFASGILINARLISVN